MFPSSEHVIFATALDTVVLNVAFVPNLSRHVLFSSSDSYYFKLFALTSLNRIEMSVV